MHLDDQSGGFYAALRKDNQLPEISEKLKQAGAKIEHLKDENVLLAAWPCQCGQGIWVGPDAAVAFDLDLTNLSILREKVGLDEKQNQEGLLLWRLYLTFGDSFIDMLRGAFAFAMWDRHRREMLVVTDAFGIRPVVYAENDGNLTAASRIKYLLNDRKIDTAIDPEAVYHYLFFQAICSPLTIYRSIRKLPPGEALKLSSDQLKKFPYYDIRYRPDERRRNESCWRQAIYEAVKKAVAVYVPLSETEHTGCYLSGGTDSSSVAGFYTQISDTAAKTFSIGFDEAAYNELDYAHLAARHFGTKQFDYCVTPQDVLDLILEIPLLYDEPFGNASVVPAYYCAKLAKTSGVDILLGGDGGDEIFGGNERYVKNLVFSFYHRFPAYLRTGVLEPLLANMPHNPLIFKAKRYIRRANFPNPDRFYSYNLLAENSPTEIFQPEYLRSVDTDCFMKLARHHYQNAAPAHDTDRLLYLDMKFTVTDNDLRKVTRMAEAAGINVRYPLLDRDLVDFTTTIPPQLKVKWGKGRYIFKRAMEGFLPSEIIKKSKHGMGLPISVWFRKDAKLSELMHDMLSERRPLVTDYLQPKFLRHMLDCFHHETETSFYGDNLWVFLILELWLKCQVKR